MEQDITLTVLILEDEEMNRMLLGRILEKNHCKVLSAENGREAIDLTLKYRPHIAFVDVNLETENGLQVLEKLREEAGFTGPAFAATGSIDESDLSLFENSSISDYFTKPYDRDVIKRILDNFLSENLKTGSSL